MADVWWLIDPARRRIATDNILLAGIETERDRAVRIAKASVRHMGLVVAESLKSSLLIEGELWREHVELEIPSRVRSVLEEPGRGMIVVSGHLGNWELAAHLLSRWKPVSGVTRRMDNPWVERLVQRRKPRYAFEPIPKLAADAARFVSVLDQGKILALLNDQYAGRLGMEVDFFGHPAKTFTIPAMLHLVTRAPLCFASCRRIAPRRFVLSFSDLIEHRRTGDRKADVRAILETLNAHLEAAIRLAPDQYLWGHRRWR